MRPFRPLRPGEACVTIRGVQPVYPPSRLEFQKGRRAVDSGLKSKLLTAALAIYVAVLMVAAADELFDLGIFPPELDRRIAVRIKDLHSTDPAVKKKAEQWLVEEGHQFAIRQLIQALRDPQIADDAAKLLKQICSEMDLDAQAAQAVKRLNNPDPKLAFEAQWELVEIGHFGVPAMLKAMGHPDPKLKDRLRRALVQATAMYFDCFGDPLEAIWVAEKRDARAAELVMQLANPALAPAAEKELQSKALAHVAIPRLITALYNPELRAPSSKVLAAITGQKVDMNLAQWEEWYAKWWADWYKKNKDKLGFGKNYKQWKLWYRMNKDHL